MCYYCPIIVSPAQLTPFKTILKDPLELLLDILEVPLEDPDLPGHVLEAPGSIIKVERLSSLIQ